MKLSKTRISFFWGEEKMKANSTQCSQASVPLIECTFFYKVKRKEEDSDQKTAVCLERETRHLDCHCFHSNWFPSKERCSCFWQFHCSMTSTKKNFFKGLPRSHKGVFNWNTHPNWTKCLSYSKIFLMANTWFSNILNDSASLHRLIRLAY